MVQKAGGHEFSPSSLSVHMPVTLSLSLSISLCLSLCLCLSVCLSFCLCLSISVSPFCPSLSALSLVKHWAGHALPTVHVFTQSVCHWLQRVPLSLFPVVHLILFLYLFASKSTSFSSFSSFPFSPHLVGERPTDKRVSGLLLCKSTD